MSLLTPSLTAINEQLEQQRVIIERLTNISKTPLNILQTIYFSWSKAFNDLHGDSELRPQLLEALGTSAKELFELNSTLTEFLLTNLAGKRDDIVTDIQNRLSTLPEFTFHEDGRVSVA